MHSHLSKWGMANFWQNSYHHSYAMQSYQFQNYSATDLLNSWDPPVAAWAGPEVIIWSSNTARWPDIPLPHNGLHCLEVSKSFLMMSHQQSQLESRMNPSRSALAYTAITQSSSSHTPIHSHPLCPPRLMLKVDSSVTQNLTHPACEGCSKESQRNHKPHSY